MQYRYLLVLVVVFVLVNPTDAWRLRRIGRKIKNGFKAVGKAAKKIGCKLVFGVGCPVAVGAAGAALTAGSSGTGTAVVAVGVMAGKHACKVRSKKCKRSADMELLPFSDDIRDYDSNGDKRVSYEEFVFAVMRSVDLADPTELERPFMLADYDGNGHLDVDEFIAAPFLFAHALPHTFLSSYWDKKQPVTSTESTDPLRPTSTPSLDTTTPTDLPLPETSFIDNITEPLFSNSTDDTELAQAIELAMNATENLVYEIFNNTQQATWYTDASDTLSRAWNTSVLDPVAQVQILDQA